MYEYAWLVMNFFAAAAACVNYILFPYIYTEYGSHTFIIYLPHVAGMKNSHNADFTLVLLKIFDVHLVFCRFLKTYFLTILLFCGRGLPKKVPNLGVWFFYHVFPIVQCVQWCFLNMIAFI